MDILFATDKLDKNMSIAKNRQKVYGNLANPILQRLDGLKNADSLAEARNLPGRMEALTSNRIGQYSMRLSANYRLIFEPANEPLPLTGDGGVDLSRVHAIRILGVEDYH